jgi:hypothetical protein
VPLYFFNTKDNGTLVEDEVGSELPDLEAAKAQAAMALVELARDVLPGSTRRTLTVEVRDERRLVLRANLIFEAVVLGD